MPQALPTDSEFFDIIAKEALKDRATLKRDLPLEDLGIDSLDVVSILFEIEDRYGVQLEGEEIGGCKTLGDMLDLFKSRLAAAA
ncbi:MULTISPECIES: acyl carrier protein [unclassified Brevundimonas]|uniref:acyl carrier protein n=1 Tax=unclassified Brevundimonas TaxID=2622653 RepID=UPI003F8E6809